MKTIKLGKEQTESSAKSRTILMKVGWQGALDNPLFGVGTGCWFAHYNKYINVPKGSAYEPHSVWIKIAAELGFVGLGAYIFMFLRIIINLRRIQARSLRRKNMKAYNYAGMLELSIWGYCATATFINQAFFEYMFLVIATSGAFIRLWREGHFEPKEQPVHVPKPKKHRYTTGRRI
jgi:O-antigen ligase